MDFGTWGTPLGTLAAAGLSQLVVWQIQNNRDSRLKRSLETLKLLDELNLPTEAWRVKVRREAATLLFRESKRAIIPLWGTVFMVAFFSASALGSISSPTTPTSAKCGSVFVCFISILWFIRDARHGRELTKNSSALKVGLRATYKEELQAMHGEYLPLFKEAGAKKEKRVETSSADSPAPEDAETPSEASGHLLSDPSMPARCI